jgi:hypothetical protein
VISKLKFFSLFSLVVFGPFVYGIMSLPPSSGLTYSTPSNTVASRPVSQAEIEAIRDWHIAFKLIVKDARIAYSQGERSGLSAHQSRINTLWREPERWAAQNPAVRSASLKCDQAAKIASDGISALRARNADGLVQLNAAVDWSEQCYMAVVR